LRVVSTRIGAVTSEGLFRTALQFLLKMKSDHEG